MTSIAPAPQGGASSRLKVRLHAFAWRHALNLWPCIRGTGGRIQRLSPDFRSATVRLPLNWRTRNAVGTIFGGSMAAATDPMYMLMLKHLLGHDYVVWDKGFTVRFRRPGTRTLYAHFHIDDVRLAEVLAKVDERGEADFTWPVVLQDEAGIVHAEVERTLYVADKATYRAKLLARAQAT